jgi:hypothetical protein
MIRIVYSACGNERKLLRYCTDNLILRQRRIELQANQVHQISGHLTPLTKPLRLRSRGESQEPNKLLESTVTTPISRLIGVDDVRVARVQMVNMRITSDGRLQLMLVSLELSLMISLSLGLVSLLSLVVSHLSLVSLVVPHHFLWDVCPSSPIRLTTNWSLKPLIDPWIPNPVPSDRFTRPRFDTVVRVPRVGDSLIGPGHGLESLILVHELPLAPNMAVNPFGTRVIVKRIGRYGLLSIWSVRRRVLMLPEVPEYHCMNK